MTDPLRLQILDALVDAIECIDGTGSWRNTVATAAIEARGFDDPDVQATAVKPWVGIVPQKDQASDEPFGSRYVAWPIDVLAHFDVATKTARGIAAACEEMRSDIRRAIYGYNAVTEAVESDAPGDLGIEGVVSARVSDTDDSTAAVQAATDGVASVSIRVVIEFVEEVNTP